MPLLALSRLALATSLALSLLTMTAAARACDMNELANLPVSFYGRDQLPVIPATIDDHPTMVLLDIGATEATLNKSTLEQMGIRIQSTTTNLPGADLLTAYASKLMVGAKQSKGWFPVADLYAPEIGVQGGTRLLLRTDLEISLADKHVKFFRPSDCRKTSLAYWDPKAYVVPFDAEFGNSEGRPWFKVSINGHQVNAIVSPSAPHSYLDSFAAARMGITPQSPGAVELESVTGWRGEKQPVWLVPTKELTIGNYTMQDFKLRIINLTLSGEMLVLGADFLRTHRVLLSVNQRRMYFSPNGAALAELKRD